MLDDENLFSYPYFHATHAHPTAKFLKLYVQVVNSIHFISDEVRNQNLNAHNFLKKLV